jgi:hypothetical protein
MTDMTIVHAQIYNSAVYSTCDQVDACIKGMYQLMSKFEELATVSHALPKLAQQM